MKKICLTAFICLLMVQAIFAQWIEDPYQNTAITENAFDQLKPKLLSGSDGFSYVAYFSYEDENYNIRMQKLDSLGNKLWGEDGLLISDHPSYEWNEYADWDIKMDEQENIILVFPDLRNGNFNIYAYKISPDGVFTWGQDGIIVSDNNDEDVNPKIAITSNGNIVIAWQRNPYTAPFYKKIVCQKVSYSGELLWENETIVEDLLHDLVWPYIYPANNDDVILFWHWEDFLWWPDQTLYCQKIDESGFASWSQDLPIYSNQVQLNVIPILEIDDGMNDHLFICWSENIPGAPLTSTRIQQIDFDGNIVFAEGGISISSNEDQNQMYPQMSILPEHQEVFVFWSEQNFGNALRGMYGQVFSYSGTKLWGENGIEFIPLSNTYVEPIEVLSNNDDVLVIYKDNDFSDFTESKVKAMRIKPSGEYVWYEESITLSEVQSDKPHFSVGEFNNNQWIAVWDDLRNGNADIYGQNILLNGSLGPASYEENFIIEPDSVYLPPAWDITSVNLINNGFVPIEILNFPMYNYLNGWEWYIANENMEFPFTIEPGEYFEMLVHVVLYTGGTEMLGWECDWILVETETNNYEIELCVDDDYLNTNSHNTNSKLVKCYPVPATNYISFETQVDGNTSCEIVIINSLGKQINSFTLNSNQPYVWDLCDNNNQKVPAGNYYYRLISDNKQESGKIILIE